MAVSAFFHLPEPRRTSQSITTVGGIAPAPPLGFVQPVLLPWGRFFHSPAAVWSVGVVPFLPPPTLRGGLPVRTGRQPALPRIAIQGLGEHTTDIPLPFRLLRDVNYLNPQHLG